MPGPQRPQLPEDQNELPNSPINPVGHGLAGSPEAQALGGAVNIPSLPVSPQPPVNRVPALHIPVQAQPQQADGAHYVNAGSITAEQLINGDAKKFIHLDDALHKLVEDVRERILQGPSKELITSGKIRFDPHARAQVSEEIDREALKSILEGKRSGGQEESAYLIASTINEIVGLGPIEPLWQDPTISEVMVNGPDDVYIERRGLQVRVKGARFRSKEHLLEVCQRILAPLNRKLDVSDPLADGRLQDDSRVNAVHYDIAPKGPLLTIRRFPDVNRTLADLVDMKSMPPEMAAEIAWLISLKATTLIVGGTGSGKAFSVETLIPTPSGFVKMGELKVGDMVFDEHGKPTRVIGAYDVQNDRKCYEVTFSDGSKLIADAEHLWQTETRSARRARSRIKNQVRARVTALPAEEVEKLKILAGSLPSDAAVSLGQVARSLDWETSSQKDRLYRVAKEISPVGFSTPTFGNKKENLFLAGSLLQRAIERYEKPWRDQRSKSEIANIRTTEEIKATLMASPTHANHSIPIMSAPADMPIRDDLLIAPRLLGHWLGNGDTNGAFIASADSEITDDFIAAGYKVKFVEGDRYSISGGFRTALRAEGVINNKHIPEKYLFSSEAQRRALLSGLLDTDGSVGDNGQIEFYSSKEALARQVLSLVASLGYRPTIQSKDAIFDGRNYGLTYTVAFQGRGDEFGLTRKRETWKVRNNVNAQWDRHLQRYIVDVVEVDSVPVRCIRVENESHLFLAGETYITTHNTTMLNALSAAIPLGERVITIEDSLELRLNPESHVAALEARVSTTDSAKDVSIKRLVRNALRMNPDRIIVGEIRDESALDMLQASNTGHEGSMSTVHANGANEAVSRIAVMIAQGGEFPVDKVDWLVGSALDFMVTIRKYKDGSRRVSGLYEVEDVTTLEPGRPLLTRPIWEWKRSGEDENGMLTGDWVRTGDISERINEKLGLQYEPKFTWDDVLRISHRIK